MTSDGTLVISVDLEFFDSAFLFRARAPDDVPEETRTMGVEGIEFIASLLEDHGVRGTFFTLGEVAEQNPNLVAELDERGHEVASHGFSKSHPDLRERDPTYVQGELTDSKQLLESVIDDAVTGFRAPAFAVDESVIKAVADAGYLYDSSVVPSRTIPGFYGAPHAPREPFMSENQYSTTGVVEFPLAVAPWIRLPVSGAWMRLLGRRYALWGLQKHLRRHSVTAIYIHPWELVEVPQYDQIPNRVAWRTGEYTRRILSEIVTDHADRIARMGSLAERFGPTKAENVP